MRHEATLRVGFCDGREAEIAELALAPDNRPLPRGLSIGVERSGRELVYRVICRERPLESLLTTLDDIIQALILVERSVCSSRRIDYTEGEEKSK